VILKAEKNGWNFGNVLQKSVSFGAREDLKKGAPKQRSWRFFYMTYERPQVVTQNLRKGTKEVGVVR
jgi:hypothetical protein